MAHRRIVGQTLARGFGAPVGLVSALGLAAVAVAAAVMAAVTVLPAATAGASGTAAPVAPFQSAACGAAPAGYATCLVHLWHHGTPGTGGPQGHGRTTGTSAAQGSTPSGYSPQTITTAYGFSTTGGAGETIAVVDAFGAPTVTRDLQSFDSQYGLPCTSCFTRVNQAGGTTSPRATAGWALETSLDVEWAHALAPRAHVLLVEATTNSDANLFTAVRYAAAHAQYVSMSWGGSETAGESTYDSSFTPGVSFFAATGDTHSEVIYPASSPDVVAVGGTTLDVTSTGAWQSESAWATGGGGCSRYETASPAQAAFPTYDQANATCAGKRATPDLSLDANPSTGVAVYDTERVTGLSGWIQVGGTSAATVMTAAHAAETATLVDAADVYGGSLKTYNVTSGSNGHTCVAGYNLCTGLGSWNTAVGTVGASPTGSLSFSASTVTVTAGTPVQLSVSLSAAQTGAVPVTVSAGSGGELSITGSTYSSSVTVSVPAGATSAAFWYENTKAGTATLSASSAGWAGAAAPVDVEPGALQTITVSPGSASLREGATQAFTAAGADAYGNPVSIDPTWTASTLTGATVSPSTGTGTTFTAGTTAGTGTVTATAGSVSGHATVTVTAALSTAVTVSAGSTSSRAGTYQVPLTVTATSASVALSQASVSLDVFSGTCSGTPVASGTGSTSSRGTASFTFSTRSTGSYCAEATVTKPGYATATGTTSFTVAGTTGSRRGARQEGPGADGRLT